MTFATIMIHLDLSESNDARLRVAHELAERHGAKVIGVAGCQPQPMVYADGAFAQSLVDKLRAEAQDKLNAAKQQFHLAFQSRAKDVEWRSAFTSPNMLVAHEARAADLVITGVDSGGGMADALWRLDASELVMNLGRPMIVVPVGVSRIKFDNIVVGWKDTREARRAIADALPLLKLAKEVTVVEIIEADDDRSDASRHVADVAGWLARHKVTAAHRVPSLRGNAAQQLATEATEIGADLVVAGAYGHTRLREWIFGGVTNDLIRVSKQCAFLSH